MTDAIRILLVDDEEIVGKRLQPSLVKKGYHVEFCRDGAAAIRRLGEACFDIVVTDIRMQEVDGLDILAEVQRTCPGIRTIMMTGYARADVAREAQVKGAFDLIAKPFRPSELLEIVDRAVRDLRQKA